MSEQAAQRIFEMKDRPALKFYERLFSATLEAQKQLTIPDSPAADPFAFVASASLRGDSGCWEPHCRLEKLDFLGRYAALYADCVMVPLPLERPSKITSMPYAKTLLYNSAISVLRLRQLIDSEIVIPLVMTSFHCEHTKEWVEKMVALVHRVADHAASDLAPEFRIVYQVPDSSPTGRSTIYANGPRDFLEHGSMVMLFDEGPRWRSAKWKYNQKGKVELTGRRKTAIVRRVLHQIAEDTTFYLAFGRQHSARYLSDRAGETLFLDGITADEELAASSKVMGAYLQHALPLVGDLPLTALLRIRRQERESFARYRLAIGRVLETVLGSKQRLTKREAREIFRIWIEPELQKMRQELTEERQRQSKRISGGLVTLAAGVALGAFGGFLPLAIKAAAVGGSTFVGGRLLGKAAESACEHGSKLRTANDFYFLLRLTQETEKN